MHRMPGRAAVFAARPLTATIASAVAVTGLLAAPAPASLAAASAGHPAALPVAAARPGTTRSLDAASSAGVVTGVLHTITGAPAAGLCVTASGSAGQAEATTSADGRYFLTGLRHGRYSLMVSACQRGSEARPLGTVLSSLPRSVTVTSRLVTLPSSTVFRLGPDGAIDGRRAATAPLTLKAGASARTGSISGLVTGAGHKLAGICVSALRIHGGQLRNAVTGKSGKYRIGHLRAGHYVVIFFAGPKMCPNTGNWLTQFYPDKTTIFPRKLTSVPVAAGKDASGIDGRLKEGGQISGTVRTQAGKPVAHLCVEILGNSASTQLADIQIRSGKSGTYVVHGLFHGSYRALFTTGCGNTSNLAAQWWRGADRMSHGTSIRITGTKHVTGIDASLRPGAIVTGTVRSLTGKHSPIRGVCVSAFFNGFLFFSPHAVTDSHGRYKLTGLSTGGYEFVFNPDCQSASPASFLPLFRGRKSTAGRTYKGVDVLLRPAAGISGMVKDARGKPVAGVCVSILDDNEDFAETRPDGSYSLRGVQPGRHGVAFTGGCGNKGSVAPQFYDNQASSQTRTAVTFTAGQFTRGIDAVMQPGGTIAGMVTNAAGAPLPGICAGVAPVGDPDDIGGFEDQTVSNAEGNYRIANVAPGAYAISIGCQGGKFSTEWFPGQPDAARAGSASVTAGATTTIDARLQRAGTIAGTVTTKAGKPLPHVCVDLADPKTGQFIDPTNEFDGITNRHGNYRIGGLTPGRYLVQFFGCGVRPRFAEQWFDHKTLITSATPVTVRPARTTSGVNAALAPAGGISGKVTDSAGKPVSGVCIEALSVAAEDGNDEVITNAAGKYTVTGLAATHYAVSFRSCGKRTDLGSVTLPSVAVRAGVVRTGVNVRLTAGGSISGTVSADTLGTNAGANICVIVTPVTFSGNLSARFATEQLELTGSNGHYTVGNLAPGTYKLSFNDALCEFTDTNFSGDFIGDTPDPLPFAAQWYSGKFSQGSADEVIVTASKATTGVDVTLEPPGSITGAVVTTAQAGVRGACVTAVPQDTGLDPFFGTPPTPETAISGRDGRYSMIDLQPGRYKIKFSPGCGATDLVTQWWDGVSTAAKATVVTVGSAKTVTGINATLHK